jgi:LacI family purine nucleotide synthesis repressor
MATIKDVAKMAGVSTTTVSHVINKTRFVAENTQKRVWDAIEVLHYAPSAVARSLKSNTTRTIGMLVSDANAPFFMEIISGVENYCYRNGYTVILCSTQGNPQKQRDYLRMLAEKRVDGLIVMCSELDEDLQKNLENHIDIPKVVMDWSGIGIDSDKIIDKTREGSYMATKYLIEMGHKKIGCITGHLNRFTCQDRLQGYYQALSEANLEINQDWIIEGDFEFQTGSIAAEQFIQMQDRPTALYVFNDIMSFAAISKFVESGIRVPEDMSIIGYDNIEFSSYFSPPLPTIHQPKRRLGKTAVELLFERMKDKDHDPQTFTMNPELIERSSVKNLNV